MYQLDQVGRLSPTSLDVSRAAAARHAHTSALRDSRRHPSTPAASSGHRRFGVVASGSVSA